MGSQVQCDTKGFVLANLFAEPPSIWGVRASGDGPLILAPFQEEQARIVEEERQALLLGKIRARDCSGLAQHLRNVKILAMVRT